MDSGAGHSYCFAVSRTTILGAILAGGTARRFGSDKAAVEIDGVALIDHVARRLAAQTDAVVVVGRDWPGLLRIDDLPRPGLGPLGGLAGALDHARAEGHRWVLTSGCDLPEVPDDLRDALGFPSAVVVGQPLLGLWDAALAPMLLDYLAGGGDLAMRSWIAHSGARRVAFAKAIANINAPDDLAAYLAARARQS